MTTTITECCFDETLEIKPQKAPPKFYYWGQAGALGTEPPYSETEFQSERTILPDTSRQSWESVINSGLSKVTDICNHDAKANTKLVENSLKKAMGSVKFLNPSSTS
ncbi:hypothetical protein N8T08_007717 [Aspergillus melleus]|uniref:Uncharacterized protein n=1 Tax=Aspergillus melleus TaxID=138277 RepID=A0ACC3BER2_9EURO|nr:hypothetical protein N8T08_007717 [Aspergillus melleus]